MEAANNRRHGSASSAFPGRSPFRGRVPFSTAASALLIFVALLAGCANERAAAIHLNAGTAYLESRQYVSAIKELRQAVAQNPSNPASHYYLGIAYHAKGTEKDAILELQTAISLKEDYSEAYNYLGMVYDSLGDFDRAIANFKKALANILYETPSFAWNNLGWTYFKKKDYDAAIASFSEALKLETNAYNRAAFEISMGRAFFEKGDFDTAVNHFTRAAQIAPELLESRYWLGKSYRTQNKTAMALQEFQIVISKAPNTELALKAKEEIDSIETSQKRKAVGPETPTPRRKSTRN
jgi:type IV pilus assembly protein PilF